MKSECKDSVGLFILMGEKKNGRVKFYSHTSKQCFIKILISILPPIVFLDFTVTSVQTIMLKAQCCLSARVAFKAQAEKRQRFH